jgi:hypothetical protein
MEQTKKINNLTFLEFIDEFRGKRILNQYGKEIPKYILFWKRLTPSQVKEKYNLVNRK